MCYLNSKDPFDFSAGEFEHHIRHGQKSCNCPRMPYARMADTWLCLEFAKKWSVGNGDSSLDPRPFWPEGSRLVQVVVIHMSPVEAFATGINNFDQ